MKLFWRNKKEDILRSPDYDLSQTLVERFLEIVELFPKKIAVEFKGTKYSYKKIHRKSSEIANTLIEHFGKENHKIAIFLPTGVEQIISILGVLKAGMTYVPIDVKFPIERVQYILKDSDALGILVNDNSLKLSNDLELKGLKKINLSHINSEKVKNIIVPRNPEDTIMIVYTSGSSGNPKGVVQTNLSILHFIYRYSKLIEVTPKDRFGFYISISFSAHAMPIFTSLLNACKLNIYEFSPENFTGFTDWYKESRISVDLMIPSILRKFVKTLRNIKELKSIRVLVCGGESLYKRDLESIWKYLRKNAAIYNIYASSEAYLVCANKISRDDEIYSTQIPIGYPVEGIEVQIEKELEISDNAIGELLIKSKFISPGYYKSDSDNDQFYYDDKNDSIIFRSRDLAYKMHNDKIVLSGRSDSMVKIRGHRVDLNELEKSLMLFDRVSEAAAVIKKNPYKKDVLVAYVVLTKGSDMDIPRLKTKLGKKIPEYMIPQYLILLDELPKNSSGKIDRNSMPEPKWDIILKRNIKAPESETEKKLVDIFKEVLEIDELGIEENLLKLGSDSLKLFVAFNYIEKEFGMKINIDENLSISNIKSIAKKLN